MRLSGKRTLVVGASSGLGKASAVALSKEGARICVAARRADRLAATVAAAPGEAMAVAGDVLVEDDCTRIVETAVAELGGLDALVYAPGISNFGPVEAIDADEWRRVFGTNVFGFSLIMNAAIGALRAARGRVVVFSSITIDDSPPRPQQGTYGVSKVALERLVQAWQTEHREVGFTSIANGDTISEFGHGVDPEAVIPIVQDWQRLDYMYGRMMEAESVAEQVVNALVSRETIRRIAITPAYPEALDENLVEDAAQAVALNREKGGG